VDPLRDAWDDQARRWIQVLGSVLTVVLLGPTDTGSVIYVPVSAGLVTGAMSLLRGRTVRESLRPAALMVAFVAAGGMALAMAIFGVWVGLGL
jgi:hypothetical protein